MRKKRPFEIQRDLMRALIGPCRSEAERQAALLIYIERLPQEYARYGIADTDVIADIEALSAGDSLPTGPYLGPRSHSPDGDGDFKNAAAKLENAKTHFKTLAEVACAISATPPMMEGPFVTNDGVEYRFVNAERRDTMQMSLIFGDIMHNLRSALDVTISEIVRLRGQDDKDASFPFGKDAENLENVIRRLVAKNVFRPQEDNLVEEIRKIEPHWDGNFLLRSVAEFNNEDKHRNIVIGSQMVSSPKVNLGPHHGFPTTQKPSTLSFNFPLESCLEGFPLISTLEKIITEVEIAISRLRRAGF